MFDFHQEHGGWPPSSRTYISKVPHRHQGSVQGSTAGILVFPTAEVRILQCPGAPLDTQASYTVIKSSGVRIDVETEDAWEPRLAWYTCSPIKFKTRLGAVWSGSIA